MWNKIMTKKQILLLGVGLILCAGLLLGLSWFFRPTKPAEVPPESTEECSLATMEVYPERTEEQPSGTQKPKESVARRTEPAEEESRTLSRNEYFYGTEPDPAEWDYSMPEVDFEAAPSISPGLPEVAKISKEIENAVDGKTGLLQTVAAREAYLTCPSVETCQIELLKETELVVTLRLTDGEKDLGFLVYHKEDGSFDGAKDTYR